MKLNIKRFGFFLIFILLLINLFGVFGIVSAAAGDTYNINYQQINVDTWYGKVLDFFNLTGTWRDVVLGSLLILIIFAALYDILEAISIFKNPWVKIIIAGGLALAAALTNVISKLALNLLEIVAKAGAIGIVIEILICIIIFVGLAIGSTWIAKWAAKRKGLMEEVRAIEGAGQAKAAIRGMREIQKEFKRK